MTIVSVYAFTMSFLIFKFINFVLPIRVTSEEEELGLDFTQHDEKYLQGTLLVTPGTSTTNGKFKDVDILKESEVVNF
jgi:Amt family ammonium transporter